MGLRLIFKNTTFSNYIGGEVVRPQAPFIKIEKATGRVTITSYNGGTIHFTTNGQTPTSRSDVYSSSFIVSDGTTVMAIVILNGVSSAVTQERYVADKPVVAKPTISIDSEGNVTIVAISGTIHYTTNGQIPTPSSLIYSKPFNVEDGTTIKAISVSSGVSSAVAEKTYHKEAVVVVPPPVINIAEDGMVTITAVQGTIHHTTDGSKPSHSVVTYTGPFKVESGTTIKALAYYNGVESEIVEKTYIDVPVGPSISNINWIDGFATSNPGKPSEVQKNNGWKASDNLYTLDSLGLTLDSVLLVNKGFDMVINIWEATEKAIIYQSKIISDGRQKLSELPRVAEYSSEDARIRISIGNNRDNSQIDANTFVKSPEYANLRVE